MDDEFKKKIIALRGALGEKWLESIPSIIKTYEKKWNIKAFSPLTLSYNYVAFAKTRDGKNVVLKISFPENHEFPLEVEALNFFDGVKAIRIINMDKADGIMLLEKADPGTRVRDIVPENKQISIVSDILKNLYKPVPKDIS